MAGSDDVPAQSEEKPSGPRVKNFSCPKCGASVTIRTPGLAMSVVCSSCRSVIDVTDENYKILHEYAKKTQLFSPLIPFGTRGKLQDKLWEVIGYVVRQDQGSHYIWEEYLLFNPYYGYRWLTLNGGHWSVVRSLKKKPQQMADRLSFGVQRQVHFEEQSYSLYYSGRASVIFALGEFYWRIKVGDSVQMMDFISPPYMLSSERVDNELTWSLSEYIERDEIALKFQVKTASMPQPTGIAPHQPSKMGKEWKSVAKVWAIAMVILTFLQIAQMAFATNKLVLTQVYNFSPNTKNPDITTPVFTVEKAVSNLRLDMNAPVDNSWFYVAGELVNDKTGETFPFERSIESYHGVDGGEAWSEGSSSISVFISQVPAGDYYINLDTESGAFSNLYNQQWSMTVRRDVPTFANYFWCLLFLSPFPILVWWNWRSEEVMRWSESDFSPYSGGSTDWGGDD